MVVLPTAFRFLTILCILLTQHQFTEALSEDSKEAILLGVENLLNEKLSNFAYQVEDKISQMDSRITQMVSKMDTKMTQLDTKMTQLDTKTTQMDSKMTQIGKQVTLLQENLYTEVQDMRKNVSAELEALKDSVTEIKSLSDNNFEEQRNMSIGSSDLLMEIKSQTLTIMNQLNSNNKTISTELDGIKDNITTSISCPEDLGFFGIGPDGKVESRPRHCFKIFTTPLSWTAANSKCQSEGLILAEPSDSVVVALNTYVVDTYGVGNSKDYWLGAKRHDGNSMILWQHSGLELRKDNPLWEAAETFMNSHINCLEMNDVKSSRPYDLDGCDNTGAYPLCEVIRE